ncbi:hypothetical protein KKD52_15535 [Myxococcota bacterium]|nr:hypothetical protein [Myxococcota bacterium]MBU1409976.1 hypothetical protein [Myxococcota bacterium]MBU1511764.1 hypothetical protein [Myxococcota bacterium]
MKHFLMILMLAIFPLTACDDDPANNSPTCDPACEAWEACNAGDLCAVLDGRCNGQADCDAAGLVCNTDNHTCEAGPVCNTEKTPSGISLPADTCGDLTECIESADCPADFRCENLPVDGETFARACCVEAPRGCEASGTVCTDEFDCDSGLCIARNDGQTYCTHQCDGPEDCAAPISECGDLFIMMVCVEPLE